MTDKSVVLVVDDDPLALDIIEGFLFQEGYDLVFGHSGPEAMALMEETAPDLVLLDVMMPDRDGFTVCQDLKASEKWRHIPVILITALGGKTDLARGFMAGADDFLHKPINDVELRARVRAMLRLKKQHDELRAMVDLREELAHMIVHDVRNPLTTILGYCDLTLALGPDSPSCLENVAKIRAQALSLNSFLNDMLLLAKMEANQLVLHYAEVDLGALLERARQNYELMSRLKKANLVIDVPASVTPVMLDVTLFQRVVDNLLSNALKFSPSGRTIVVRVRYPRLEPGGDPAGPQLRLQVIDEGPGVPEADRERIFDKFEILAMAQNPTDGIQMGLGLAFAKMVVKAHGGRIFVTPNQPVGSVFTIEI